MSKNPIVYGYCDAGCRRRVPTYEEYANIANYIKQIPDEEGRYKIEFGKKYKIFAPVDNVGKFAVDLCPSYGDGVIFTTLTHPFPYDSPYQESFLLEMLDYGYGMDDDGVTFQCALHFVCGQTVTTKYYICDVNTAGMPVLYIVGATKVMLVNEGMEVALTLEEDVETGVQDVKKRIKKVEDEVKALARPNDGTDDGSGDSPSGSSGNTRAIIDVDDLPTENINSKFFYRTLDRNLHWYDGEWHRVVDMDPESGEVNVGSLFVYNEAVFGDNDQVTIDSSGITVSTNVDDESVDVEIGKSKNGIKINGGAVLTEKHLGITSLDTNMQKPTNTKVNADGISWQTEAEIEVADGLNHVEVPYHGSVPLVPGANIEFEPSTTDEGAEVVRINAEPPHIINVDATTHMSDAHMGGTKVTITQDGIIYALDEIDIEMDGGGVSHSSYKTRIPLVPGKNVTFTPDAHSTSVVISAEGGGSGGMSSPMLSVTYEELKSLRDSGSLIAGMCYRITDYQCTTVQTDTRAIGNRFDIIVRALSNNTLSETAYADYHYEQGLVFDPSVINGDKALVEGAVTAHYYSYVDQAGVKEDYPKWFEDVFVEYAYLKKYGYGDIVPALYKNSPDSIENGEPADYDEAFYYLGTEDIDGTTYDKWGRDMQLADMQGVAYLYTNRIITNGFRVVDFGSSKVNIPAWELKYCLDNDTTRFAWALDGQMVLNVDSMYSNGEPLIRQPSMDGRGGGEYPYAWGVQADVDDGHDENFAYSKNEILTNGDFLMFMGTGYQAEFIEGKGVIYYMKDEHGNECPYDFKNIQFKRMVSLENGYPELDEENGEETWVYTFCGNSYHIDNDEWSELKDGSLESPYGHMSDADGSTFQRNTIKPYVMRYDADEEIPTNCGKAYLNNIVFLGYWEEIGSTEDAFCFYYAYCPHNNTFDDCCSFMTIEHLCNNNTFGRECRDNIITGSSYNDFGIRFEHQDYNGNFNHYTSECKKVVSGLTEHNIEIKPKSTYSGNVRFYVYKTIVNTDSYTMNPYNLEDHLPVGVKTQASGVVVRTDDDETVHTYNVTYLEYVGDNEFEICYTREDGTNDALILNTSAMSITDTVREL